MNRGGLYFILGAMLLLLAIAVTNVVLEILLAWTALGAVWFGLGYVTGSGELLFKSPKGRLPVVVRALLFPILLGVGVYNYFARKVDKSPAFQEIREGIWLGRRLLLSDLSTFEELGIKSVLDVTAEFDALSEIHLWEDMHYLNIPVMDHHTMQLVHLKRAVSWMHEQREKKRPLLVHCALGQGRSVTVLLAFLKTLTPEKSYEALLDEVKHIRSSAQPNRRQMASLLKFEVSGLEKRKPKVCLIHNPVAGLSEKDTDLPKIKGLLDPYVDLNVKQTTEETTAAELAKDAIEEGFQQIVASGGDGTVAEVATELVGKDVALGIIPRGTANALAVCLYGKSVRLDPIGIGCRHIVAGLTRNVDVAEVGGRYMFLLTGLGLEAGMVERADRQLKNKLGPLAYIASAFIQLEKQAPFQLELEVDGKLYHFESGSVVVANAAPLTSLFAQGGNMPDPEDGMLDVTVLLNNGNGEGFIDFETVMQLWDTLKREEPSESEQVKHFKGHDIRIKLDPRQRWVMDGEVMDACESLSFRVVPGALRVFSCMENEET